MSIIVQKYGGTSVDGRERLMAVARRVAALRAEGHDVVVVVSAQGGATDALLAEARSLSGAPAQRELDMLMTAGERVSMSLLAIALNAIDCPAISFTGSQVGIITDTKHTSARILEVRPHRVLRELERGFVVVVGGFQGVSVAKEVTTLGRGGSDTTAIALAAALAAERCEILTDVDAVYTADPRKIPKARRIGEIRYEDMAELARCGAVVLKEEAVRFAEREGIVVHVGSSAAAAPGTIVLERPRQPENPIVGLSALGDAFVLETDPEAASGIAWGGGDPPLFAAARDGRLAVAVRGAGEPPDGARPASILCVVGAEAASPATLSAVAREAGPDGLLALAASGRSTLAALRPEAEPQTLRALHSRFFPG